MKYFIIDAFTDELFKGNQAGVCLLDEWLPDDIMQKIAYENNLSETAFVVKRDNHYDLRWFTPTVEVDLCGHATLASAFVIFNSITIPPDTNTFAPKYASELTKFPKGESINVSRNCYINTNEIQFETKSGPLAVEKKGDLYEMDFPSRPPTPVQLTRQMSEAIGTQALEAHLSRDLILLLENEQQVKNLTPDFEKIMQLDYFAVVATAKGDHVDFVSRFFTPRGGVPEDPVTGSAHCSLIPFWARRLGKDKMVARQLSKRGGTLFCENLDSRVKIAGQAVLFMQGEIKL